jgi:uncharacterized OB-fold protein
LNVTYLPVAGPSPELDDKPFWDACRRHELRFQRCSACGRFRHPPSPVCARCYSTASEWVLSSGTGRVFSYTIVHHPVSKALRERVPYNVVVVEFPECGGVRLISNIVNLQPWEIRTGLSVSVTWETADNGISLPRFSGRPKGEA